MIRIGVLASGGGTNLQAILDHLAARSQARHGDVVLVASNRPDAGALTRADRAGITRVVDAVASGEIRLGDDGRVVRARFPHARLSVMDPSLSDASLAAELDLQLNRPS